MGNGTFILSRARCLIACIYLAQNENKYHIKGPGKSCFNHGGEKKSWLFPIHSQHQKTQKKLLKNWSYLRRAASESEIHNNENKERKRERV